MALVVLTQPAVPPVSLADAKAHCRVDHSTDDVLISALVNAAGDYVSRFTRKPLIYTTYRYTFDTFPEGFEPIELPRQPVVHFDAGQYLAYAVPRVRYYDTNGTLTVLNHNTDFEMDLGNNPPRLHLPAQEYWPLTQAGKKNAVEVDFVAGFAANSAGVPELLRQAILMMVAHWYENREAVGNAGQQVPLAVDSILRIHQAGEYN